MYSDGTAWGAPVRRGFAYVGAHEIHFRHAGPEGAPVVLCLHPSPASSLSIAPLVGELGRHFRVLAPDTLGNGDSSGPLPDQPEIGFYAGIVADFLKSQGVTRCTVYGCHTGAAIGMELALRGQVVVERLILDGVGLYDPAFQQKLLARYVPDLTPDREGLHVLRLWTMLRDMYLFWPWFEPKAANRRPVDLPPAATMHARFVETAKALTTFGHSYKAAFRYDKRAALPRLALPVLVTTAEGDMLSGADREVLAALPMGLHRTHAGFSDADAARRTGELFRDFLTGAIGP